MREARGGAGAGAGIRATPERPGAGLGRALGLFGRPPPRGRRDRITLEASDRAIYAVGDVHGALPLLQRLEELIVADMDAASATASGAWTVPGGARPLVVMLGDLLDRGPFSAPLLDHVRTPHPRFERLCLAGNHEEMALDVIDGRLPLGAWERAGGGETLRSLGLDAQWLRENRRGTRRRLLAVREAFGAERIAFLRRMPVLVRIGRTVLVHGGVRLDTALEQQSDATLTTLRPPFGDPPRRDVSPGEVHPGNVGPEDVASGDVAFVVHGHTPAPEPWCGPHSIGIDTEAWRSGRLTALRLLRGRSGFLST